MLLVNEFSKKGYPLLEVHENNFYILAVYQVRKNLEVMVYDLQLSASEPNERITCKSKKALQRTIDTYMN